MASLHLFIISGIISLITIFLIIIYSVNKHFRSYPFFFNIIITLSIAFDNIIRLIPIDDKGSEDISILCQIQAFALTFFDKLMLTLMTVFLIISYLGIFKQDFYKKNEKLLFIILLIFSLIICTTCTIIFSFPKINNKSEFCYVETENIVKKWVDSIVTGLLFIISLFCIIKILSRIIVLRNENKVMGREDSYNHHLVRFTIGLFIYLITFIYVLLIINKLLKFLDSYVRDLIYILIGLAVELFFTINTELIRYIKKIFSCEKDNDDNDNLLPNSDLGDTINDESLNETD